MLLEFAIKTFLLTDNWFGMTMDDIRKLEDQIKAELDIKILETAGPSASN